MHRFRIKVGVFVPAYYSERHKALSMLQKFLRRVGPGGELVRLRVARPLSTNPPTDLIGIDPGALRVDVHFEELADGIQKLLNIRPHFDYYKILTDFSFRRLVQLRQQKVLLEMEKFREV